MGHRGDSTRRKRWYRHGGGGVSLAMPPDESRQAGGPAVASHCGLTMDLPVEDRFKRSSMMWASVRNARKRSKDNKPIKGGRAHRCTYAQVATPASE